MFDKSRYDVQILMGINYISLKHIKEQLSNNKVKVCCSLADFREFYGKNLDKKIRLYVDEFMYSTVFCNNIEWFMKHALPLINDGYFCSSLNSKFLNVYNKLKDLSITQYVTLKTTDFLL